MQKYTLRLIFGAILTFTSVTSFAETYRYFSISSGGMLGIGVAEMLRDIEDQTGKRIDELVDGMCGTSTGALISSLASVNAPNSDTPYTPEQMIAFYRERAAPIFQAATVATVSAFFGAPNFAGSSSALKKHTEDVLGNKRLSDARIHLMILSHDKISKQHVLFDSQVAKADATKDLRLSDAARASSSVAMAFGSVALNYDSKEAAFVDAGSVGVNGQVNDPVNALIARLLPKLKADDKVIIYALGTGFSKPAPLMNRSAQIEVIYLQPNVNHLAPVFGMDLLAADTTAQTIDKVLEAVDLVKISDDYMAMIADLKGQLGREEL